MICQELSVLYRCGWIPTTANPKGTAEKRRGDSKLKMEHTIVIFGGQIKIYSGDHKLVRFTEIAVIRKENDNRRPCHLLETRCIQLTSYLVLDGSRWSNNIS